jgi:hypothetical protein
MPAITRKIPCPNPLQSFYLANISVRRQERRGRTGNYVDIDGTSLDLLRTVNVLIVGRREQQACRSEIGSVYLRDETSLQPKLVTGGAQPLVLVRRTGDGGEFRGVAPMFSGIPWFGGGPGISHSGCTGDLERTVGGAAVNKSKPKIIASMREGDCR